jgi:hypothetical protein
MTVARMTLNAPAEWMATFEQATSQEEWDRILSVTERLSPGVHLAAKQACQGRDSRSKRLEESRERARELLDSI